MTACETESMGRLYRLIAAVTAALMLVSVPALADPPPDGDLA